MNAIIEELVRAGVSVTVSYDKTQNKLQYEVPGFYKSGSVLLFETDSGLIASARYSEVTAIKTLRDLIWLNYDWWQRSKDRFDDWKNPDPIWIPLLLNAGLIKSETKTEIIYHSTQ